VLDNLYEELTLYPRRSNNCRDRNSIMGGLSGFNATFANRIHRFRTGSRRSPLDEFEASGKEGLAVQEVIEAKIQSHEVVACGRAEGVGRD
jgi:hypothetical protein